MPQRARVVRRASRRRPPHARHALRHAYYGRPWGGRLPRPRCAVVGLAGRARCGRPKTWAATSRQRRQAYRRSNTRLPRVRGPHTGVVAGGARHWSGPVAQSRSLRTPVWGGRGHAQSVSAVRDVPCWYRTGLWPLARIGGPGEAGEPWGGSAVTVAPQTSSRHPLTSEVVRERCQRSTVFAMCAPCSRCGLHWRRGHRSV
jgi:hypothetical protein